MLESSLLARVDARARQYVQEGALPCAVLALANHETLWHLSAWGEGGREELALADRLFLLASISKAITGTAIARLVDAGELDYDNRVASTIPEFAQSDGRDRITLAHIFTHSTGLPALSFPDLCRRFAPGESYRAAFEGELLFEPGTRMCYNTHAYQLLNEVVRRRFDVPMSRFLQAHLFEPCAMVETGFRPAEPARAMPVVDFPFTTPDEIERYLAHELSGAGIWSSARDLVRLGQALLRPGMLLRPEAQARLLEPHPGVHYNTGAATCRTYGWVKEAHSCFPSRPEAGFYHGGATATLLWIDPERDLIFVFLSNYWCSSNDHAFTTLELLYHD